MFYDMVFVSGIACEILSYPSVWYGDDGEWDEGGSCTLGATLAKKNVIHASGNGLETVHWGQVSQVYREVNFGSHRGSKA